VRGQPLTRRLSKSSFIVKLTPILPDGTQHRKAAGQVHAAKTCDGGGRTRFPTRWTLFLRQGTPPSWFREKGNAGLSKGRRREFAGKPKGMNKPTQRPKLSITPFRAPPKGCAKAAAKLVGMRKFSGFLPKAATPS
jgi:hypothetical protein